ncbi:unnamed protein product [Paramecium octaurelia]|uniref:YjeF C-terminal domain-containing protein n=1 Tax=Paramecium octaurelia TaxID=43137 RepID=A0A8S1UHP6_PAROT|nr:unnamed protein product [Paramecium octaurelia]
MFKQNSFSKIIPLLDKTRHKGQNGKIASIGRSFEQTGAPYYAAISTLKGGGDLAQIFSTNQLQSLQRVIVLNAQSILIYQKKAKNNNCVIQLINYCHLLRQCIHQ